MNTMMPSWFSFERTVRLVAVAAMVLAATSIIIGGQVRPAGVIEGIVMQSDNGVPVASAMVTLSGGPIKSQSLGKLSEQLYASTYMPDNVTMLGVRNYMTAGGMAQPAAQQAATKMMAEGLPAGPTTASMEDGILQNIMRYSNVNFGTSPFNSEFVSAISAFRAANAQFKAITDRSGRFTFRDVPEGQYTVRVERDGYYGRGSTVPQTGTAPVTVSSRQPANVTVPMVRGATLSGRLRDIDGLPLANATVQAFAVAYSNGLPALRAAASNKTNDRGEYSIFWLPPGEYLIAMVRDSTQIVGGYLLQQVVGTFYPGTASVTEAVPVTVRPGQNLDGIDFTHRISKPVRISGRVVTTLPPPAAPVNAQGAAVNPANQARQAVLMLLLRDPQAPDDIGARTVGNARIEVAKGFGDFEFEITQPGSYDLYARIPTPNGAGPTPVAFGRVAFDARDDNVKDVVVKVDPVTPLNGVVTVNGSAPGQNNLKISMQVDDSGAKLPAYGINIRSRTVAVDPAGSYTLPGIFVGHWQVYIEGLTPEMYVADVRQGASSVFDTGVTITGETPSPLQVVIRTDSGTVDGTVVDAARRPVPGASVVLAPPDARRQNRLLYKTATADANGHFTIRGVAPGTYKIFSWPGGDTGLFSSPIDGGYFNPKYMARFETAGKSISVTQAAANVELTVIPLD
jgi:hypothetical protein